MNTAHDRWCSVCLRWHHGKTGKGWTTDRYGAWVCPRCSAHTVKAA